MDASADSAELANALERFQQLLDPDEINAKQDYGPATIYTPWVVVWLLVYQRLHGNATLQEAVGELFRLIDHLPVNRRVQQGTLSGNTAAYSRARTRLEVSVCEEIAEHVFDSLMETTPPSWQQRRVFLIDGTTTKLGPNKVLQRLYPPASNQHGAGVWPILHWAVAHELSSGCAVRPETGAMYGPEAVSEVTLASRLIRRLPAKSVLLADRNFGVLAFHYAATQAGHDVVSRLTESRFRSMVRRAQAVGPGRWQLDWRPTRGAEETPRVAGRRVRASALARAGGRDALRTEAEIVAGDDAVGRGRRLGGVVSAAAERGDGHSGRESGLEHERVAGPKWGDVGQGVGVGDGGAQPGGAGASVGRPAAESGTAALELYGSVEPGADGAVEPQRMDAGTMGHEV